MRTCSDCMLHAYGGLFLESSRDNRKKNTFAKTLNLCGKEWTECTLCALVYIPKTHVPPTQNLEVLLLAVLVIIVTTTLLLAVLVIIVTTTNFM